MFNKVSAILSLALMIGGCGGNVESSDNGGVGSTGGSGECVTNLMDIQCSSVSSGKATYRCGVRYYTDSCYIDHALDCGECPSGLECQDTYCIANGGQGGSAGTAGSGGSSVGGSAGEAGSAGAGGFDSDAGADADAGGAAGSAGMAGAGGTDADAGNDADAELPITQIHFSLSPNPISSVFVKKSQAVEALGLDVEAPQDSIVSTVQLRCQASLHGQPYQTTDCASRITSIALFEGATQVGLAMAPSWNGDVFISQMNWTAKKGQNKLVAKISLASTASTDEPFDKVSIGFVAATAQDAVTSDYVPIEADWDVTHDQLSDAPKVFQTIRPSGTFKVVPDGHPASTIVIAGDDVWKKFAGFRATAQYEPASSDMLLAYFCTSEVNGCKADNSDFTEVAVASNGVILGTVTPPPDNNWWVQDLPMFSTPLITPKDGSVHFELWGKMASIVPTGTGPATGVARSGHAPALGLLGGYHSQEWDAAYIDKLNIRTTGEVSGERLYSEVDQNGSYTGNPMVVRRAKPIVTKQSIANTVLMNMDQDVLRFQASAQGSNPYAFRQLAFEITKSKGFDIAAIRLRRGSVDIDPSIYRVVTVVNDVNSIQATGIWATFVWNEGYEETISGSGNVYTVHGLMSGVTSGSNFHIRMEGTHQSQPKSITGYLLNDLATGVLFLTSDGTNANQACPSPDCLYAAFGWTDFSGSTHQPLSVPQGSPEWTDGFLVEDIQGVTQTLAN